MPPPLVLCAQAIGYGPAGKVVTIADRLRVLGLEPVFLGTGIAHELASRSEAFRDVVASPATGPRARALLRDAAAVLSMMETGYARVAHEQGTPTFVADSLAWIRDPVPPEFLAAERYWVQNFPGVPEHLEGISPAPELVGAIVPDVPPVPADERAGMVVNLGGYETPYASTTDDSGYAEFVVGGLLDSGLLDADGGETRVLAGRRCAEHLARRFPRTPLRFSSVGHAEARRRCARAARLLTAPGLTTTLEGFSAATPTFFLPPQNYSQWWVLSRLRTAGLAPSAFHWEDHLPDGVFRFPAPPGERVPMVRGSIRRLVDDPAVRKGFRARLEGVAGVATDALAAAQRDFVGSLGPNGASAIARHLAERLETRPPPRRRVSRAC